MASSSARRASCTSKVTRIPTASAGSSLRRSGSPAEQRPCPTSSCPRTWIPSRSGRAGSTPSCPRSRLPEPPPPTSPDGRPATVPSGPSRFRDLRADPGHRPRPRLGGADRPDRRALSPESPLVGRLRPDDPARDRSRVRERMDALATEIQGKPLDTLVLIRCAMLGHSGYDDAMMKQFLRDGSPRRSCPAPRSAVSWSTPRRSSRSHSPASTPMTRSRPPTSMASSRSRSRQAAGKAQPAPLWIEADGHASGQWMVKDPGEQRIALRARRSLLRQRRRSAGPAGRRGGRPGERASGPSPARRHEPRGVSRGKPRDLRGEDRPPGPVLVHGRSRERFSLEALARRLERTFLLCLKRDREFNNPKWPFLIKVRDVEGNTLIDATFKQRSNDRDGRTPFDAVIQAKRAQIRVRPDGERGPRRPREARVAEIYATRTMYADQRGYPRIPRPSASVRSPLDVSRSSSR